MKADDWFSIWFAACGVYCLSMGLKARKARREYEAKRDALRTDAIDKLRLWADSMLAVAKLNAASARMKHQDMTWNEAYAWVQEHFTTDKGKGPLPDEPEDDA